MKGWKLPFMANIPVEKETQINEQIHSEMVYESEKDKRIATTFKNKSSNLRKVADFLLTHLDEELSYDIISNELGIPVTSVRSLIGSLNFFNGFPLTFIPVKKKPGFLQSVLKNQEAYESWDKQKMKTITTMVRVKDKAQTITSSKRVKKKKVKVSVENEQQT